MAMSGGSWGSVIPSSSYEGMAELIGTYAKTDRRIIFLWYGIR